MRLQAIFKQKCPHCLQGEIFDGFWHMRPTCPVCAVRYEREDGYFMMAVFVGYVLSLAICLPVCLILYLFEATILGYVIGSAVALTLASPLIFRYARVIWMHIDELLDPRPTPTSQESKGG